MADSATAIKPTRPLSTSIRLEPTLQEAIQKRSTLTGETTTEIISVAVARYLRLC